MAMVANRLTPMFKDEKELLAYIYRAIEVRAQGVIAPLGNPKKPFGDSASEPLRRLLSDAGLTQGQVAISVGVPKSTLGSWIQKPSSLKRDTFVAIAVCCAKASSGDPEKEDAFEHNLTSILPLPMDAQDERDAMRAATFRRIKSIAEELSDTKLAALLDVAVAFSENDAGADDCGEPPSWPLRYASAKLRDEREQAEREAIANRIRVLRK